MAEMHSNCMRLVNKVSLTESIDNMVIFNQEDLFNLVSVTDDIYNKADIMKVELHLDTLLNLVRSDDKLALVMC